MICLNPQAPNAVVMIRPHRFEINPETQVDNSFQKMPVDVDAQTISSAAYNEFSKAAKQLEAIGITVHIFEDETGDTPDSVFPNNWFSTHSGGHVAVYPMFAENRRMERRSDVIELLKSQYRVQDVIDYSGLELDGLFLEGTGAMVVDHMERVVYAVQSNRTDPVLLERFCTHFNYEPMVFHASDPTGKPVYHTNVLMCIATEFSLIGLSMISDSKRRDEICLRLRQSGKEVIELNAEQVNEFAGNAMELTGSDGRVLVMSQCALNALTADQVETIERYVPIMPLDVHTIEMAGGSVRCMLAGIHLSPRT